MKETFDYCPYRGCHAFFLSLTVFLCFCGNSSLPAASPDKTGKKWLDMNYGPFLSFSIEAPEPRTNIAFKGIAVNLGKALGSDDNESIVFDTDLLRYSAGWTGNFLSLKSVVHDGEHWAYPKIDGEQVFGNPSRPGWARNGRFDDPREFIYGPLPRDWAHWRGLYLHGERVIFSYTVGQTEVLEMPGLEKAEGLPAFARTFSVGKSSQDLLVQIAYEADWNVAILNLADLRPAAPNAPARATLACLENAASPNQAEPLPAKFDLSTGLYRRWSFDESPQETNANQPNPLAGIELQKAVLGDGRDGRGLVFEGAGRGDLGALKDLEFLETDLTLATWINRKADGTIIAQAPAEGNWARDGKSWFIRGGRLAFDIGWVGAVQGKTQVPAGKWTHVALTWKHESGTVTLHVNGRADGSKAMKPANPTPQQVWRLGFTTPNFPRPSPFKGSIDDLRIYRRALTEAELLQLAQNTAPPRKEMLIAGLVGAPDGTKWVSTQDGHLRLAIPATATPARFKLLLAGTSLTNRPAFARLVKQSDDPEKLEDFTRGGPARWQETLLTQGKTGDASKPLAADEITSPERNPWDSWMRFGGFDFFNDASKAAICTWSGDVWLVSGLSGDLGKLSWRRFATGLYEPLGLKIVEDQIYVLGRDQITRLHDLNADGEADWYENFNNDCLNSEHFHEFVYDLQLGPDGDFYYLKGSQHARDALHPHHGTFLRVSGDGSRTEVLAKGFRAPNGLGVSPQGEFFTTDQEGYWMPQNRLNFIERGKFHGNVLSWFPEGKPATNNPPMCWVHRMVDRSPSTMVWVTPDKWGPLKDQLLSLSYGVGKVFLVMMEEVKGVRQAGLTELPLEFETGIMRARFQPETGDLFICGLYGWAGDKTRAGGFYRVRPTGKPLRVPSRLHIVKDGVVIGFSTAMAADYATDPANYHVQVWNYKWTGNYGSPDFKLDGGRGRDTLRVERALLSGDRRQVFLSIPDLGPVMQMHIQMNLKSADGLSLQTYVHNTIHQLNDRTGREWLGPDLVEAQQASLTVLAKETAGLAQTFVSRAKGGSARTDARQARLLALLVPEGSPPTPFLPAGPFDCQWSGYVKLDLSDNYEFHAHGLGNATLKINGHTVLERSKLNAGGVRSTPIAMRGGLNRIEVAYQSPPSGESAFRLEWSTPRIPPETIPPTMLVHDAKDAAREEAATKRSGRFLFATLHCAKCHQPAVPFSPAAMPELAADGPALDDAGNLFNAAWMARWLRNPGSVIAEATMPALLAADDDQAAGQAQDIAAFLATLKKASPPIEKVEKLSLPESIQAGEERFTKLGCIACHLMPQDKKLPEETRRSLAHVNAKWQPPALIDFLKQPEKHYAWIRMPNYQLTDDEAVSLAAYLLAKTEPLTDTGFQPGDAGRGAELAGSLGCANCHSIPGAQKITTPPSLEKLAQTTANRGCLGGLPEDRAKAPKFAFETQERQALASFLKDGLPSLSQVSWSEFAGRQFNHLRCFACHERENVHDFWFYLESLNSAGKALKVVDEEEGAIAEKTIHQQRPSLMWTGEKLRPDWIERFLTGKVPYKPRRKLEARMPAFPAYAPGLAVGLTHEHGLPEAVDALVSPEAALARVGKELAQKGALSCVDCHDTGKELALAGGDTATINFAHIPERLRKTYYDRYLRDPQRLLPGTMMPKFINDDGVTGVTAHWNGNAQKQFEALWHFMLSLEETR